MAESWPLLPLSSRRLRRAELADRGANIGQHAARALAALWSRGEEEEEEEERGVHLSAGAQASWMAMKSPV